MPTQRQLALLRTCPAQTAACRASSRSGSHRSSASAALCSTAPRCSTAQAPLYAPACWAAPSAAAGCRRAARAGMALLVRGDHACLRLPDASLPACSLSFHPTHPPIHASTPLPATTHLVPLAAAMAARSAGRPSQATFTLFTLVSWLRVPSTSSSSAPSCRRTFIWFSTCGRGQVQACAFAGDAAEGPRAWLAVAVQWQCGRMQGGQMERTALAGPSMHSSSMKSSQAAAHRTSHLPHILLQPLRAHNIVCCPLAAAGHQAGRLRDEVVHRKALPLHPAGKWMCGGGAVGGRLHCAGPEMQKDGGGGQQTPRPHTAEG